MDSGAGTAGASGRNNRPFSSSENRIPDFSKTPDNNGTNFLYFPYFFRATEKLNKHTGTVLFHPGNHYEQICPAKIPENHTISPSTGFYLFYGYSVLVSIREEVLPDQAKSCKANPYFYTHARHRLKRILPEYPNFLFFEYPATTDSH